MSSLSDTSSGTPSKFGFTDGWFLEVFCPEESVPTSKLSKTDSNPSSLISKAGFILALALFLSSSIVQFYSVISDSRVVPEQSIFEVTTCSGCKLEI